MADLPGWDTPGARDAPRRSAMAVVLIVLLVLALGLGILWATRGVVDSPVQPQPPAAAPTDPAATSTGEPQAGRDQPAGADIGGLVRQVAAIRQLRAPPRLRSRLVSESQLAAKVSEIAFDEMDEDELAADERLLVALRLAPPDLDLAATLEALYREQVLGLYVPKEKTLYVRTRDEGSPAERITTAHEITHALQDRHFDLVGLQESVKDDTDAGLAVLSLIEGDAVITQQLWALRHLDEDEQREAVAGAGDGGALAAAPDYLRASLFFPYQHGAQFVGALFRDGGYAAVDEAFANPPTTSEHILHPERYLDGDAAADVVPPDRPGPQWGRPQTYDFGEFDLLELLRPVGTADAEAAAAGWGGGELRMWSQRDEVAIGAVLAFDSGQDADEACAAIPAWYTAVADATAEGDGVYAGDRDHMAIRCDADEVRFGLAPDAETAGLAASPP